MMEAAKQTRNQKIRRKRAIDAAEAKVENIDFKMVTFTLAGKDYGIDIMKVKEIAKFINFTYVPNTPPFVRGVYNLRGEIISIIDLREMFNLPYEPEEIGGEENGLILRLESNMIGVIVDKIDKVVGISSDTIQPPHPIFGDINIKYISGVVENEGRLYIILDVERILGKPEENKDQESGTTDVPGYRQGLPSAGSGPAGSAQAQSGKRKAGGKTGDSETAADEAADQTPAVSVTAGKDPDAINKQFISETLEAFEGFFVTGINSAWFDQRFQGWKRERSGGNLQLENQSDAAQFMEGFSSPNTGRLWEKDLFDALFQALPDQVDSQLHIWNPGCGKGYETYSLAVLMKKKYPSAQIKIWASDKDLLAVSSAPNLIFHEREVPEYYRDYMVEGPNGLSFNQEIKDAILFEYHDIVNAHTMPPIQLLVARDLFSFLPPEQSARIMEELDERLKTGGIVILGANEEIPASYPWEPVSSGKFRYFRKK
jgi:purine-binding chemotaxis protein CheW